MKEARISDAELRRLIARPLVEHLRKHGFHTGRGTADQCVACLPVDLDLAGIIEVHRDEDGVWTFRQQLDIDLADRTEFSGAAHTSAMNQRETRPCR